MKVGNITRFWKYSFAGLIGFSVDLLILFILVNYFNIYYIISVGIGLLIGICLNYTINYYWGFKKSKVGFEKGHSYFLSIGVFSLIVTLLLMGLFVEIIGVYYLLARIIVGAFVGILSFLINSIFTFKTISLHK